MFRGQPRARPISAGLPLQGRLESCLDPAGVPTSFCPRGVVAQPAASSAGFLRRQRSCWRRTAMEASARGLEIGADDGVARPFSAREPVARISLILRRAGATIAFRKTGMTIAATTPARRWASRSIMRLENISPSLPPAAVEHQRRLHRPDAL